MLNDDAVKSMNDILVLQNDFGLSHPQWRLKELLRNLIPEVEFTKPKNPQEAEILHLGEAQRIAMVNQQNQKQRKFAVLFHAAKILRGEIRLEKSWKLGDEVEEFSLPPQMEAFTSWLISGEGNKGNVRIKKGASMVGQVITDNVLS